MKEEKENKNHLWSHHPEVNACLLLEFTFLVLFKQALLYYNKLSTFTFMLGTHSHLVGYCPLLNGFKFFIQSIAWVDF